MCKNVLISCINMVPSCNFNFCVQRVGDALASCRADDCKGQPSWWGYFNQSCLQQRLTHTHRVKYSGSLPVCPHIMKRISDGFQPGFLLKLCRIPYTHKNKVSYTHTLTHSWKKNATCCKTMWCVWMPDTSERKWKHDVFSGTEYIRLQTYLYLFK